MDANETMMNIIGMIWIGMILFSWISGSWIPVLSWLGITAAYFLIIDRMG